MTHLLHESDVVAVELQQLLILASESIASLSQVDMRLLDLVLALALPDRAAP